MYYSFTLDSVFRLVLPKGSELTWQTSMLYIVLLIYVNETIYLYRNLHFFKFHVNRFILGWLTWCQCYLKTHVVDEGLVPLWVLIHLLSVINSLLLLLLSRFSHVRLSATPRTAAHQATQSLGFSRQETLEWVAITFSNAWKWKVKVKLLSRVVC